MTKNNDVQAALSNSEQILIDALKFYATKEHWMSNTENGQPLTLCALKHALDYAGWVHAHGQLQRWAVAKHGEDNALAQQQPDAELLEALKKQEYHNMKVKAFLEQEKDDGQTKRAEQKGGVATIDTATGNE